VHDILISGNQVTGNDRRGIVITGGNAVDAIIDNITISNNTVQKNGTAISCPATAPNCAGIVVSGGSNNTGDTGSDNATISNVSVTGNTSKSNQGQGIRISQGGFVPGFPPTIALAQIANNVASSSVADDGIFIGSNIPGLGHTPISGNQANSNQVNGIELRSTGYSVFNNTASSDGGCGIILGGNING